MQSPNESFDPKFPKRTQKTDEHYVHHILAEGKSVGRNTQCMYISVYQCVYQWSVYDIITEGKGAGRGGREEQGAREE